MKTITFNNLPAGSVVLAKSYNLWERLYAWVKRENLPYNDGWIDPFGRCGFCYKNTLWRRHEVFTFTPKKQYNRKEMLKLFEIVLPAIMTNNNPVEGLLTINLVRPETLKGKTLEELFDNNKYYIKNKVK